MEQDGVKTSGKDQEEKYSSESTLVPASGSFKSGWASWGCNVPLITQELGNYTTGFLLASQSHRKACGFTHGHVKASAHSFFSWGGKDTTDPTRMRTNTRTHTGTCLQTYTEGVLINRCIYTETQHLGFSTDKIWNTTQPHLQSCSILYNLPKNWTVDNSNSTAL